MRHMMLGLLFVGVSPHANGAETYPSSLRIADFKADVTPPIGHGMMGGAWLAKSVGDPLEANGFVLLGHELPIVFVAVDWCEIRNDAYTRWQEALASAAGTKTDRVIVTTIHQHDAPVADLEAERILRTAGLAGTVCDLDFHERSVQAVARAVSHSLHSARVFTHIGIGQGKVEQVASNRRYTLPDGSVRFDRMSSTQNAAAIMAHEGLIDPYLKTLSFWDGANPLAAVSFYAVHPMSYYGQGEVSADFPGLARRMRQLETPEVKQIYATGCSGNIVAGKFNTGDPKNRAVLAERLHAAMSTAWTNTERHRVQRFDFRVASLQLEPRHNPEFTVAGFEKKLEVESDPFQRCLAALGLSWRRRVAAGRPILIPAIDFGEAQLLLLPGEAYVEYQLAAQQMRPNCFVCVAGYGDGATGYIPTDRHFAEGDSNLADWCWVAPGSEPRLLTAIREVLLPDRRSQAARPKEEPTE
jgi:hypothetical protein